MAFVRGPKFNPKLLQDCQIVGIIRFGLNNLFRHNAPFENYTPTPAEVYSEQIIR